MTEFEKLLVTTTGILKKLEIDYIVTGGAAVVYWGRPRFTADIDIVVELKNVHIGPLVRELRKALGRAAYIDEDMIRSEQSRGGEFNVIQPGSGLKIDFFIVGKDPFEKARFSRAKTKKIGRQTVRFISPEDLILIKLLWHKEGGPAKQLEDIRSIIVIQGGKLDKTYLKKWAERQSTIDILNQILD